MNRFGYFKVSMERAHTGLVRSLFAAVLFLAVFCCSLQASSQRVVDQILALVNNEVITLSDLLWSLALDPNAPSPAGPVSSDTLKQKLEVMIDERLVSQEAARIPGAEVSREDIDKQRAALVASFPAEAAFRQRIESVGLTPERLDEIIRQRVLIERFIDFRFRSFVFVSEQEIQNYFEKELSPRIRERGQIPPPRNEVRAEIVNILRQEKINQELDQWLLALRQRADVVVLAEPN
jgi:hypothetical protein